MIKHIFSGQDRDRLVEEVLDKRSSDRASAIVAGSVLETALENALKTRFLEDQHEVLFKGGMAVLGTFSAKIQLAYAIGSIPRSEFKNLNLVRKIRNHCAHEIQGKVSFSESPLRDYIDEIELPSDVLYSQGETKRDAFEALFQILFFRLETHRNTFAPFKSPEEFRYAPMTKEVKKHQERAIALFLEAQAKGLL